MTLAWLDREGNPAAPAATRTQKTASSRCGRPPPEYPAEHRSTLLQAGERPLAVPRESEQPCRSQCCASLPVLPGSRQTAPSSERELSTVRIARGYRATVAQLGEDEQPAQVPRVCTPRARAPRALGPWWSPRTRHQWQSSTDLVTTGRSVYAVSTSPRETRYRDPTSLRHGRTRPQAQGAWLPAVSRPRSPSTGHTRRLHQTFLLRDCDSLSK